METYILTLFSAKSDNRTGTDISDYSYFVNWGAVIPEKYKTSKFLISFTFHSDVTSNTSSNTSVVIANGLNLFSSNFQGITNALGCIYIVSSRSGSIGTFGCSSADNQPVMGNYPNSNTLNILILDITNFVVDPLGVLTMPNYMMTISFTPIKD
jgi:hypothetical protein